MLTAQPFELGRPGTDPLDVAGPLVGAAEPEQESLEAPLVAVALIVESDRERPRFRAALGAAAFYGSQSRFAELVKRRSRLR
jgi:hypothetical protein